MNNVDETLREAESAIQNGSSRRAFALLAPLLRQQIPDAMYLASCIGKERESREAFDMRRFWLLNQAARLGHAHSIYLLGVQYECGDGVIKSIEIASALFERAALLGHGRAKLSFGLDLVRGLNRIPRDVERGLEYIRQAAAENVEGAAEILDDLMAQGG
ncbi:tetratricopeptide repeat protein [Ralstonia pseudosolanacearum]